MPIVPQESSLSLEFLEQLCGDNTSHQVHFNILS